MKDVLVAQYHAFSSQPGKGNPAGVILDGSALTGEEMQRIAQLANMSECCFVLPSQVADYRFRYFMPNCETPLCGHATVATVCAMMNAQQITQDCTLSIETQAGIISVDYNAAEKTVLMTQIPAQFQPFTGDIPTLMAAIGLTEEAYNHRYPIVYGSTGTWTLIVPICTIEQFAQMTPHTQQFPTAMTEKPNCSIHPILLGAIDPSHQMHGRHFSSITSGVVEDPVTGTASGVMGGYYLTYLSDAPSAHLLIEQGNEMGLEGTVHVYAQREGNQIAVSIAGTAALSQEKYISL